MHIAVPVRSVPFRGLPSLRTLRRGMGQTDCPQPFTSVTLGPDATGTGCIDAQTAASASTAAKTGAVISGASSIGASILALSAVTGPAAPFVAIGGALVSFATGVLHLGQGCGATCIEASNAANYVQCVLALNLNTYMTTWPRYASAQAAAKAVYSQAWTYLVETCDSIGGEGGKGCLEDRQRGGKYDYFAFYLDPIANDPCVAPDPTPVDAVTGAATTAEGAVSSAVTAISSLTGISSSIMTPLLIVGAMLVLSRAL